MRTLVIGLITTVYVLHVQDRMAKLPELVAAAKCVIENVDSNALLSYFGLKTDLRPGAPAIKV